MEVATENIRDNDKGGNHGAKSVQYIISGANMGSLNLIEFEFDWK